MNAKSDQKHFALSAEVSTTSDADLWKKKLLLMFNQELLKSFLYFLLAETNSAKKKEIEGILQSVSPQIKQAIGVLKKSFSSRFKDKPDAKKALIWYWSKYPAEFPTVILDPKAQQSFIKKYKTPWTKFLTEALPIASEAFADEEVHKNVNALNQAAQQRLQLMSLQACNTALLSSNYHLLLASLVEDPRLVMKWTEKNPAEFVKNLSFFVFFICLASDKAIDSKTGDSFAFEVTKNWIYKLAREQPQFFSQNLVQIVTPLVLVYGGEIIKQWLERHKAELLDTFQIDEETYALLIDFCQDPKKRAMPLALRREFRVSLSTGNESDFTKTLKENIELQYFFRTNLSQLKILGTDWRHHEHLRFIPHLKKPQVKDIFLELLATDLEQVVPFNTWLNTYLPSVDATQQAKAVKLIPQINYLIDIWALKDKFVKEHALKAQIMLIISDSTFPTCVLENKAEKDSLRTRFLQERQALAASGTWPQELAKFEKAFALLSDVLPKFLDRVNVPMLVQLGSFASAYRLQADCHRIIAAFQDPQSRLFAFAVADLDPRQQEQIQAWLKEKSGVDLYQKIVNDFEQLLKTRPGEKGDVAAEYQGAVHELLVEGSSARFAKLLLNYSSIRNFFLNALNNKVTWEQKRIRTPLNLMPTQQQSENPSFSVSQLTALTKKDIIQFLKFVFTANDLQVKKWLLHHTENKLFENLVLLLRDQQQQRLQDLELRNLLELLLKEDNFFAILFDHEAGSSWLAKFPEYQETQLIELQKLFVSLPLKSNFDLFLKGAEKWKADQQNLLQQPLFANFLVYLLNGQNVNLAKELSDLPYNQREYYQVLIEDFKRSLPKDEFAILLKILKQPETILDKAKRNSYLVQLRKNETLGLFSKQYRAHKRVFAKTEAFFQQFLSDPLVPSSFIYLASKSEMGNKGTVERLITTEIRSLLIAICATGQLGQVARVDNLPEIVDFARKQQDKWPTTLIKQLEELLQKEKLMEDFREATLKTSLVAKENQNGGGSEFVTGVEKQPDNSLLLNLFAHYPELYNFFEQHHVRLQAIAGLWYAYQKENEKLIPTKDHLDSLLAEAKTGTEGSEASAASSRYDSLLAYKNRVEQSRQEEKRAKERLVSGELEAAKKFSSDPMARIKEIERLNQRLAETRNFLNQIVLDLFLAEGSVDAKDSARAKALADYIQVYEKSLMQSSSYRRGLTSIRDSLLKNQLDRRRNDLLASLRELEAKKAVEQLLTKQGSVDLKDSERFMALQAYLKEYELSLGGKTAEQRDDEKLSDKRNVKELVNRRKNYLLTLLQHAELEAFIKDLLEKSGSAEEKDSATSRALEEYLTAFAANLKVAQQTPLVNIEQLKQAKRKEILQRLKQAQEAKRLQQADKEKLSSSGDDPRSKQSISELLASTLVSSSPINMDSERGEIPAREGISPADSMFDSDVRIRSNATIDGEPQIEGRGRSPTNGDETGFFLTRERSVSFACNVIEDHYEDQMLGMEESGKEGLLRSQSFMGGQRPPISRFTNAPAPIKEQPLPFWRRALRAVSNLLATLFCRPKADDQDEKNTAAQITAEIDKVTATSKQQAEVNAIRSEALKGSFNSPFTRERLYSKSDATQEDATHDLPKAPTAFYRFYPHR